MKRFVFLFMGLLLAFAACKKDEHKPQVICDECEGLFSQKMIMYVDNEMTKCPSNPSDLCMRVQFDKFEGDTAWVPFEQDICGFDYQPGYFYTLEIQRKKIGTDANGNPEYKYCLLRIKNMTLEPMKK